MYRLALAPLLLLVGAAAPGDERVVMVTGFDRLRIDGPFAVEVVPGSPGVTLAGDRAALDRVGVRVEAGTLVINAGTQSWESAAGKTASGARIRVAVPGLRVVQTNGGALLKIAEMRGNRLDVSLNGTGRIDIGKVDAQDLGVTLAGAGTVTLAGNALHTRVRLYGTSSLDAAALTTADALLVSGSGGALVMNVRYNAQISATSSGVVRVLGPAKCRVIGQGPVECADLEPRRGS
ncbi:hypothetical protein FHR20_002861 [Sphingomonas leidyi]|uniref:Putative auto-transporter adhesin head GIN domain-containing protein n=1 Tax=Sphingomonas leidyi TaxID=68569 RepID=A0A7X5V0Y9_9SPHN|nr:DUF2807 domain-containing protein [Sphingomonas leidyi]NIJ65899.1 hypothetical protein [Sphingomonas leidyi]